MLGTVIFFTYEKGIGFIRGEDLKSYFVHYSNIDHYGYYYFIRGEQVEFDIENVKKGARAIHVKTLNNLGGYYGN